MAKGTTLQREGIRKRFEISGSGYEGKAQEQNSMKCSLSLYLEKVPQIPTEASVWLCAQRIGLRITEIAINVMR